jgi:hypothetical protein
MIIKNMRIHLFLKIGNINLYFSNLNKNRIMSINFKFFKSINLT